MLFSQKTSQKSFTSVIADYTTSVEIKNCPDWLVEVKKKTLQGKSSLTEAIDTSRQITERGKKITKWKNILSKSNALLPS